MNRSGSRKRLTIMEFDSSIFFKSKSKNVLNDREIVKEDLDFFFKNDLLEGLVVVQP